MTDESVIKDQVDQEDEKDEFDSLAHEKKKSVPTEIYETTKRDMQEYKKRMRQGVQEIAQLKSKLEETQKALSNTTAEKEGQIKQLWESITTGIALGELNKAITTEFQKRNIKAEPAWAASFITSDRPLEQSIEEFAKAHPHLLVRPPTQRSGIRVGGAEAPERLVVDKEMIKKNINNKDFKQKIGQELWDQFNKKK